MTSPLTPTLDQITERVTAIAAEVVGVPAAELTQDGDLREVTGIDSVKVLRMIAKIEHEYDIELEDDAVFSVRSLADVAKVVSEALRALS
jgi:acyl carrier protein